MRNTGLSARGANSGIRQGTRVFVAAVLACAAPAAWPQSVPPVTTLPEVSISEPPTVAQKYQLPATTESVTAAQMAETINVMNTEDALKYLPSLIVRKRNFGDQQSPLATRTSGLGQSARSLIYADGFLLSSLIGNNNSSASPRWALVAPEEIERIDVMYGPFSAAYPGNSMGAVVEITTRMPDKFEAGAKVQAATQDFQPVRHGQQLPGEQASAHLGNRTGRFVVVERRPPAQPDPAAEHHHRVAARRAERCGRAYDRRLHGFQPAGTTDCGARRGRHRAQGPGQSRKRSSRSISRRVARHLYAWFFSKHANGRSTRICATPRALRCIRGRASISAATTTTSAPARSPVPTVFIISIRNTSRRALSLRSNIQREWDWEAVVSNMRYGLDTTRIPSTALPAAAEAAAPARYRRSMALAGRRSISKASGDRKASRARIT